MTTTQLSGISTLAIGKGYNGEIGELIGLNKALNDSDIKYTANYLTNKWSVKSFVGTTCLNGTITADGCGACNGGYTLVSGSCQANCSVSGTGITTTSVISGAAGKVSCNTGFSGSGVSYNCSNGNANMSGSCTIAATSSLVAKTGLAYTETPIAITSPCQSGFGGSPTYTCTSTGAASVSGSCSAITCSIAATSSLAAKSGLAYTATPIAITSPCQTGFSGSPTYTCTSAGAASVSGSCSAITCTIAATSSLAAKTGLAYTATPLAITSPCQSGYTGSPTYTCTTTGAASVSGSCTNTTLYHGWASPISGCLTTSYNATAATVMGGTYPYISGDSTACRAWKLAATVCNSAPVLYSSVGNYSCSNAGGFTDPTFGTYCSSIGTQYSCSGCPGACNAACAYNPLSLRNCSGQESHQP